ncbi:MAG: MarR family transcriptional regulator [Candidatus Thorarchaeota archaeon]|nr:MarR family transcriptional regulator [Candidatus Thorarchaeota archaeon]
MRSRKSEGEQLPLVLQLGPTTWRVLIMLLGNRGPVGPRDIARQLNLSSHSVAIYHLDKLIDYNLVERTLDGEYQIWPEANLGFLNNYIYVGYRAIPRNVIYASFITGLVLLYLVLGVVDYSVHSVFALTIGISAMVFLWTEVYRLWRGLV